MLIPEICEEIRVFGTHTTLILAGYGPVVQKIEVLDVLLHGQSDVINGLVASRGNAPIDQLAFTYWSEDGKLNLKIEPARGRLMKWLMLAQTLQGILQFMEIYGYHAVRQFTALDDEAGIVGWGTLQHYKPRAIGVNASSPVEIS